MQSEVEAILNDENAKPKLWFLSHPSLYTKGTSGDDKDLLNKIKFPVYESGRGGKFTYHGPGQRVVYFMFSLKELHNGQPDIKKFVRQIEEWLTKTFKDVGINAYPCSENIGIWTKNQHGTEGKLAAIGIRAKKWVIFHGVAININPSLSHYNGIVPCGIRDKAITSLWNEGVEVDIEKLDELLIENFSKTFDCEVEEEKIMELA